jgi:predicted PurR-regulated permease PerM
MGTITISLPDLGLFILFVLACGVAVFLIMTLYNINRVVKKVNSIMEAGSEDLNKTIALLPETVGNVNEVAVSVKSNVDKIAETAAAVTDKTQDALEIVRIAGTVVKTILNAFSKS